MSIPIYHYNHSNLYKIAILLYIKVMGALLFILAVFILGFIALVLIYNAKTNSFSSRHKEQHLRDLDKQFKEGKISKEDYIELRKKL